MIPNLIHPCDIVISRLNPGSTYYDEDTREPVQQAVRYSNVTIPGQVSWAESISSSPQAGGIEEKSTGYVLFRKVDLDAALFTPKTNDRFAKLGHVDVDVYIQKVEWLGHYPDQNGPTLLKASFADRFPSKQTKGV